MEDGNPTLEPSSRRTFVRNVALGVVASIPVLAQLMKPQVAAGAPPPYVLCSEEVCHETGELCCPNDQVGRIYHCYDKVHPTIYCEDVCILIGGFCA